MNRLLWVCILIAMICSSALMRSAGVQNRRVSEAHDLENRYSMLIEASGGSMGEMFRHKSSGYLRGAYFTMPDCEDSYRLIQFNMSDVLDLNLVRVRGSWDRRLVLYFDGRWPEQDRLAMLVSAARVYLGSMLGATDFVPTRQALVLLVPVGCDIDPGLDWASVWMVGPIATEMENMT